VGCRWDLYGESIATGTLDNVGAVQAGIRGGIGDGDSVCGRGHGPGNQIMRARCGECNRVTGRDHAGQASACETPLRQTHGVREHRIVIAVLPTVLETPYARAIQSLLAVGLVRIIERL